MINVDLGSERTIRYRCIQWPYIKYHKIRSVASRSRRVMIIWNKLFIRQSESNSWDSISRISEAKSTRNGRWTPWNSVVWLFEIPKCDGRKCCYYVLGHNDSLCAFWQWKVPFNTGLREIQSSISSNSISLSLYQMILYQNKYFWHITLASEWKVSSPIVNLSCLLEKPGSSVIRRRICFHRTRQNIT
jgi:hypothetical protein